MQKNHVHRCSDLMGNDAIDFEIIRIEELAGFIVDFQLAIRFLVQVAHHTLLATLGDFDKSQVK